VSTLTWVPGVGAVRQEAGAEHAPPNAGGRGQKWIPVAEATSEPLTPEPGPLPSAEEMSTVTTETPARPQRPIEETMKDILDAISELDGHEIPADVRGDLNWIGRRARRIGR